MTNINKVFLAWTMWYQKLPHALILCVSANLIVFSPTLTSKGSWQKIGTMAALVHSICWTYSDNGDPGSPISCPLGGGGEWCESAWCRFYLVIASSSHCSA